MQNQKPFISVVLPCLNEGKTVGACVTQAKEGLKKAGVKGEVIVCDNGSTDNSVKEAQKAGAKVIFEPQRGYGCASLTGIKAAAGDWIVTADSDGTYNLGEISQLLGPLKNGADLVIGSRIAGKILPGSMPFLHRYLGTPLLNFFLRLFYHLYLSDTQSGMRAFTKEAFRRMRLKTLGMEFASEMLVRASQEGLKITEVPISYSKRISPSKLSRFRDAWRHLRFMLLFAPTYLFLAPGAIFMSIGFIGLLALTWRPVWFLGRAFDFHSMILASLLTLLGYQIIMLGIYAKVFSWTQGFSKNSFIINHTLRYFRLEGGILLGSLISLVGLTIGFLTFIRWAQQGFGALWAIRPAILSMTFLVLGIQIIFSSFFLSILGIEKRD